MNILCQIFAPCSGKGPICQCASNVSFCEEYLFKDENRYRCVHYGDGGRCNRDLCGDCFKPKEASASPQVCFLQSRCKSWLLHLFFLQEEPGLRRSGREPRPSALRAGEEWEVRFYINLA